MANISEDVEIEKSVHEPQIWKRQENNNNRESMCHDRVGWKAKCSMRGTRKASPLIEGTSSCS